MYTLKQLELFVELAKIEKVIEVAKTYGMSQSAVSMGIRELEKQIDEPLFDRVGKKLVLNGRGRLLLEQVEPNVLSLRNIYDTFKDDTLSGTLSVGASVTIADYMMPSLVSSYLKSLENIKVTMRTANSTDVITMVKNGKCALGLIESGCNDPEIETRTIMTDELVVVSSDASLAEQEHYIDALAARPWIIREQGSGTRSVFLDAIAPVDRELNIMLELEHTESIKNFLLADSALISCLPRISVADAIRDKKLYVVPIKGYHFEREFLLITRYQTPLTALARHFIDYVLSRYTLK